MGFYEDEIDNVVDNLPRVTPRHGASKDEKNEPALEAAVESYLDIPDEALDATGRSARAGRSRWPP